MIARLKSENSKALVILRNRCHTIYAERLLEEPQELVARDKNLAM